MPSWAGLWDNVFAQPYALLNEQSAAARTIARIMFPEAQRDVAAVITTLLGASVGQNASSTLAEVAPVQADGLNLGGQRPISQQTLINRATTAADLASLLLVFNPRFAPTTYPVDKSGNGGGGKAGTVN